MKSFILFVILFYFVDSELTDEERKNLLNKVTKLVSSEELIFAPLLSNSGEDKIITYEPSKIKEIIDKYNFPSSYNFLEAEKISPVIKNQGNCGSCWAFASSTALSYRFHKKGINVDLSAQYPLSCVTGDCSGDYLIDSHFNLVKNGTVTEKCLPYSSADVSWIFEEVEECPTKCKDGSDIIKYHSKNAYSTLYDYNQDNYYDIVTLIMDQLINYGPLQAHIEVYEDFSSLNGSDCSNHIYKHDNGQIQSSGGHSIVIVGYGSQNNKYYWIIQNSWGEDFCDKGFVKIEFSEVGVEQVIFSEPYIEDNSPEKDVSIKFNDFTEECNFKYTSTNSENYFEMYFEKDDSNLYFQCGSAPHSGNGGICSISTKSSLNPKGTYEYSAHNTLLNKNKYTLDFSSISKEFYYYGVDSINSYYDKYLYISKAGRKIYLFYLPEDKYDDYVPKIYPNYKVNTPLSKCKLENFNYYRTIVCDIQDSEFSYFSSSPHLPLSYEILCGYKTQMFASVVVLDTKKYPIFKVKQLILPEREYIDGKSTIILLADVEGSTSGLTDNILYFTGMIIIEHNAKEDSYNLYCKIENPKKVNNFKIPCQTILSFNYTDVYLNPFYIQGSYEQDPFQVIIEDIIEGIVDDEISVFRGHSKHFMINKYILLILGALLI